MNLRPPRPERGALPSCATSRKRCAVRREHRSPARSVRGTRVSKVASGGQANRTGAYGEVPSPAETCSHAARSPLRQPAGPACAVEAAVRRRARRTPAPGAARRGCARPAPGRSPSAANASTSRGSGVCDSPSATSAVRDPGPAMRRSGPRRRCASSRRRARPERPAATTVVRAWVRSTQPASVNAVRHSPHGSGSPWIRAPVVRAQIARRVLGHRREPVVRPGHERARHARAAARARQHHRGAPLQCARLSPVSTTRSGSSAASCGPPASTAARV